MGRLGAVRFLREQWATIRPPGIEACKNKTVVITGATSGLGFEAAKQLRRAQGSNLLLTGRDAAKMDVAKKSMF